MKRPHKDIKFHRITQDDYPLLVPCLSRTMVPLLSLKVTRGHMKAQCPPAIRELCISHLGLPSEAACCNS